MKNYFFVILAAIMSLTGCAAVQHEPKMTYHADVSFAPEHRQCIQEATDEWAKATDGIATINVVYDYKPDSLDSQAEHLWHNKLTNWQSTMPVVLLEDAEACGPAVEFGCGIMGLTSYDIEHWPIPVEVRLVTDRFKTREACRSTAIHELGHGFGMNHTESKKDVMYFSITDPPNTCLTTGDLEEFCSHNDCGPFVPKGCR